MLSMPPTTTISLAPSWILCAAIIDAEQKDYKGHALLLFLHTKFFETHILLVQQQERIQPFIPDEQTLLTVVQITELGMPAPRAACLAGACPKFAHRTLPKKTSCTSEGSTFALFRAA